MAQIRAGHTPEDETQFGRQTPNGAIVWHTDKVAEKLGWTTTEGRLRDQRKFDQELHALGLALHEGNVLKWYRRVRFTDYTEPEEIADAPAASVVDPIPVTAPEDAQADLIPWFAADGPDTVGTAIDVSGSAEAGDPTHLIVGDDGLLLGTVTPTDAPADTVPEWAQTPAPTAIIPTADPAQPQVSTSAVPF